MRMTTLCYLEKGGCYLMMHRIKKQKDDSHDKWIGVGGKFEANESPEDCMKREVFEECGLKVTKWRYHGIVTFVSNVCQNDYMHLFSATEWDGEEHVCDEGILKWIPKSEIAKLQLWEGDRIFLRLMNMEIPFFSLKLVYNGNDLLQTVLNGEQIDSLQYRIDDL